MEYYTSYILAILLLFIYVLYGYILSRIIDSLFPPYNETTSDYIIGLEAVTEVGIAYLIYFLLFKYSSIIVKKLFQNFPSAKPLYFLNELLILGFSYGVFKSLTKVKHKSTHIHTKYKEYFSIKNIIDYCLLKIKNDK